MYWFYSTLCGCDSNYYPWTLPFIEAEFIKTSFILSASMNGSQSWLFPFKLLLPRALLACKTENWQDECTLIKIVNNVSVYATSCVYAWKLVGFTQLIACITDLSVLNEFAGISTLSWFGIWIWLIILFVLMNIFKRLCSNSIVID